MQPINFIGRKHANRAVLGEPRSIFQQTPLEFGRLQRKRRISCHIIRYTYVNEAPVLQVAFKIVMQNTLFAFRSLRISRHPPHFIQSLTQREFRFPCILMSRFIICYNKFVYTLIIIW